MHNQVKYRIEARGRMVMNKSRQGTGSKQILAGYARDNGKRPKVSDNFVVLIFRLL